MSASKNKVWPPPGGDGGYVGLTFHPWVPSSPVEAAESSFFSGGAARMRKGYLIVLSFTQIGVSLWRAFELTTIEIGPRWICIFGRCLSKGTLKILVLQNATALRANQVRKSTGEKSEYISCRLQMTNCNRSFIEIGEHCLNDFALILYTSPTIKPYNDSS